MKVTLSMLCNNFNKLFNHSSQLDAKDLFK